MMRTIVFNGWAVGLEIWNLCTFQRDAVFSYVEQLDGVPADYVRDIGDVVLVGFSMGGTMALKFFLDFPEKIRGLVLISATPRMREERVNGALVWKGLSDRRRAALKLGTQMVFRHDPSPLFAPHQLERGLSFLDTVDLRGDLLDRRRRIDRVDIPVWILQSDRDGIVRPENAAFLKAVFPQAEVLRIPGNEHVLPVAAPECVDRAVDACLCRATRPKIPCAR